MFLFGQNKKARIRQAASFTYDEPDGRASWAVDFETNRLRFTYIPDADVELDDPYSDYQIRRETNGRWSRRLTNDSWANQFQSARADLKNPDTGVASEVARGFAEERLAELGDGPTWEPIPDSLQPMIESHFQAYQDALRG